MEAGGAVSHESLPKQHTSRRSEKRWLFYLYRVNKMHELAGQ